MSNTDYIMKEFLKVRENVAPLLRLSIKAFRDLRPDEIYPEDTALTEYYIGKDKRLKAFTRDADCIVMVKRKDFSCFVVIEVQSYKDLLMPVRALGYICGVLSRQRRQLAARLRNSKRKDLSPDELLSGAAESDSLLPVLFLTLNVSDGEWKAESLYARMAYDTSGDECSLPDWTPEIMDLCHFTDDEIIPACLNDDCVHYYLMMSHRHDKQWINEYLHAKLEVEGLTVMAISVCLGFDKVPQIGLKEKIDMCSIGKEIQNDYKAAGLAEGRAEGLAAGRAEGIAEGRAEGRTEKLTDNIRTLMRKLSLKPEDAMDMLDVPASERAAVLAAL